MTEFDPSYGHTLSSLLEVDAPRGPEDFVHFWQACFDKTQDLDASPNLHDTGRHVGNFKLYDLSFKSTDNVTIHGWALVPASQPINRVFVVGHGYGGCNEPNGQVPLADAAYLYPCYRGLSRSRIDGVPEDPNYHVLYNINDRDKYIIRGCVEDTWMAVSAAQKLFPSAKDHIAFMGISFSGGVGALAIPWDKRIKMAHIQVPTFGNRPLRKQLPTRGSGNSVQKFYKTHPHVLEILSYYDAAVASKYINIPLHIAAALVDPIVAPPGQFSIYNNLNSDAKRLFILEKGHMDYPNHQKEQADLLSELTEFFAIL